MHILHCVFIFHLHVLVNRNTASSRSLCILSHLCEHREAADIVFSFTVLGIFHEEYTGVDICQLTEMESKTD